LSLNKQMQAYNILRTLAGSLLCLLYRVRVRGKENIPLTGGVILCANHIHMFDPVLMVLGTRRQVRFMAKAEVFSWPIIGFLARLAGAFPVKRGDADIRAVKHSLQILSKGGVLGIFPEGTRAREGDAGQLFLGVTMLAEKTGSLIVPAAIVGRYRFRQPLAIAFGKPFRVQALCEEGKYDRRLATVRLMGIIHELKATLT